MQVEVDMKCMQTNLVDLASPVSKILLLFVCFQKQPKISFRPCESKIELVEKIHANRGRYEMYAN